VKLSRKLENIGTIAQCQGCRCYIDTIREFHSALLQSGIEAVPEASKRSARLNAKHQTTDGCIGCDPCYPIAASNALYEVSEGESAEVCGASCDCDKQPAPPTPIVTIGKAFEPTTEKRTVSWPIETGDYRLGNLAGSVALATLGEGRPLAEVFGEHVRSGLRNFRQSVYGKYRDREGG
jgi:hypothetical protein